MKLKVLIVDDSALIRSVLKEIINSQSDMEVVGAAPDPYVARDMIKKYNPDVLTLDVEMPRMDGLDFLEKLMRLRPMPVVMVSTLTERGSDVTFRALELGAVDFITKPKLDISRGLQQYSDEITDKIRAAARAKIKKLHAFTQNQVRNPAEQQPPLPNPSPVVQHQVPALGNAFMTTEKVILVGASTGGTEAIKDFLIELPPDCPGILITQHMPEAFTRSFANRLNNLCRITVKEAEHNERILPGHAYIAPGHSHLLIKKNGANYVTELSQAAPVNRHRPSVDVLFRSAAEIVGKNAIGIIMTGMGKDGAQGMLEMKHAGAFNFAQDEASCIVFGMPKEAIAVGAVDEIITIKDMAHAVMHYLSSLGKRSFRV